MKQSEGLLEPYYLGDRWYGLRASADPHVTITYFSAFKRPWRVLYWVHGDFKVKGEWGADQRLRSRSFSKPDSVLKFVKDLV